jgi:phosphate transport system protein
VAADARLDDLQRECEQRAILIIARRQPVAVDLREIVSSIRIAGDLERVGDMAKNIAKRTSVLESDGAAPEALLGLQRLSDLVLKQFRNALVAYREADDKLAIDVWQSDASVDALYTVYFRELLTAMLQDTAQVTFCTHLLFCAKNLERIGDHATNLAEMVHYLITGENLTGERPKGDLSYYQSADAKLAANR